MWMVLTFFGEVLQSSIEGRGGKYKLKHGPWAIDRFQIPRQAWNDADLRGRASLVVASRGWRRWFVEVLLTMDQMGGRSATSTEDPTTGCAAEDSGDRFGAAHLHFSESAFAFYESAFAF